MTYRLRRDYEFKHAKTGKTVQGVSYHEGFVMGCPLGTPRPEAAKTFSTKALAEVYARNKLRGRGYRPERVEDKP